MFYFWKQKNWVNIFFCIINGAYESQIEIYFQSYLIQNIEIYWCKGIGTEGKTILPTSLLLRLIGNLRISQYLSLLCVHYYDRSGMVEFKKMCRLGSIFKWNIHFSVHHFYS